MKTKVSLYTATAIVVANMVGTGIFGSLGYQVGAIPSGFPILLLWLVGGIISICGALCYAELAAMFPRSGGEYQLLRSSWSPLLGFLAGWVSIVAGFAAPIALNASLLGHYLAAITGWSGYWFSVPLLLLVTVIHLGKLSSIARFQSGFTTAKILLIIVLAVLGFTIGTRQTDISFLPVAGDGSAILSADFAVSLVYVLYAYAGWNAATYMMDEIHDAPRLVPRAILLGTALVTGLYIVVNAAFLYATPVDALAGQPEAGLIASQAILGERGGSLMGLLIAFGLISTISAMTWAGPRVTSTIGQDYRVFSQLAKNNRHGVPAIAIAMQSVFAIVLLITSTFETLLHYVQALLTLSSIAVVIGMIWLRISQPQLERPFRAWGYPVTPVIFLLMTGYILYFQIQQQPIQCLWGLLTLAVGFAVYWLAGRKIRQ